MVGSSRNIQQSPESEVEPSAYPSVEAYDDSSVDTSGLYFVELFNRGESLIHCRSLKMDLLNEHFFPQLNHRIG